MSNRTRETEARRRKATARFHEKMAAAYRQHGREADADAADKAARLARESKC